MRMDFAADFVAARARFRSAARRAGGTLQSYPLTSRTGPAGETLATDLAWFGNVAPKAVLIMTSATHGVEGHAGSALQAYVANSLARRRRSRALAIVLVHAINPYGFAFTRRVNEDNVDLNRNFVDFANLPPCGIDYRQVHPWLVPAAWAGPERERTEAQLSALAAELGPRRFQQVVCEGQYEFPDGLFFGGLAPTWSNRTWRTMLSELPACVLSVAHIDIHTGLGAYGHGEILFTLRDETALQTAQGWYGDLGLQIHGTAGSAATGVFGTMNHAVAALAPQRRVCSISLEFGTVAFGRMLAAVRADNWLHVHGIVDSMHSARVKQELRACFCPDDLNWQSGLLERGMQVFERTCVELERSVVRR